MTPDELQGVYDAYRASDGSAYAAAVLADACEEAGLLRLATHLRLDHTDPDHRPCLCCFVCPADTPQAAQDNLDLPF